MSGLAQSTSAVVGDVPNVARRRSGTTIGGRDNLNADAVRALIEGGIKAKSALNIKLPPRPQSPPPRSPPAAPHTVAGNPQRERSPDRSPSPELSPPLLHGHCPERPSWPTPRSCA